MDRINPQIPKATEPSTPAKTPPTNSTVDEVEIFMKNCGVPVRYRGARLRNFGRSYSGPKLNDDGLYICGAAGVGKTHLVAAMMAERAYKLAKWRKEPGLLMEILAGWISCPEYLQLLRSTMDGVAGRRFATEKAILDHYAGLKLLVLDDIGAEKVSDWTSQSVYLLISRRLNEMRPTIVTSNLTLSELDAYDPRLASRLGGMEYLKMEGDDRRLATIEREGK